MIRDNANVMPLPEFLAYLETLKCRVETSSDDSGKTIVRIPFMASTGEIFKYVATYNSDDSFHSETVEPESFFDEFNFPRA